MKTKDKIFQLMPPSNSSTLGLDQPQPTLTPVLMVVSSRSLSSAKTKKPKNDGISSNYSINSIGTSLSMLDDTVVYITNMPSQHHIIMAEVGEDQHRQ